MNEIKFEKGMALDEVISLLTKNLVEFCIHLLVAIVVFYVGKFLIRKIKTLARKIMEKRHADPSIASFVLSGVDIVLYFLLIIIVVGIMGIETSSFIALFASAGVAIGMALSGTLQNFAGGVLILALRPYKVGDYIEAQGYAGSVKAIKLFNTEITTPDNKTIIIPNGPLFTGSINNYSTQAERRVEWTVAVAYQTDFETVKTAIEEILLTEPKILTQKVIEDGKEVFTQRVEVYLGELADSSVNIKVRAWVLSGEYWNVFFSINEKIYTTFNEKKIPFPFPQLDVHLSQTD